MLWEFVPERDNLLLLCPRHSEVFAQLHQTDGQANDMLVTRGPVRAHSILHKKEEEEKKANINHLSPITSGLLTIV